MPGLTNKLLDKLFDKEQNIKVTELLKWLYDMIQKNIRIWLNLRIIPSAGKKI